jgi:hypothetical protein
MSVPLFLFMAFALILILLLAWAVSPPKKAPRTPDEVLEALSEERHYARLPQILQSLREDDTEFLRTRGHGELLRRLRGERKTISLQYLRYLEEEYQVLLEASRILATLDPELSALGEFERFRRNLYFFACCRYLRWRLRLGLQPWNALGILSDMAGEMTLRLETAAARLGERALIASEYASLLEKRGRDTQ